MLEIENCRQCYLYHEHSLAFFTHYTEESCRTECEANHTMKVLLNYTDEFVPYNNASFLFL